MHSSSWNFDFDKGLSDATQSLHGVMAFKLTMPALVTRPCICLVELRLPAARNGSWCCVTVKAVVGGQ
jgi:hypothetical protein